MAKKNHSKSKSNGGNNSRNLWIVAVALLILFAAGLLYLGKHSNRSNSAHKHLYQHNRHRHRHSLRISTHHTAAKKMPLGKTKVKVVNVNGKNKIRHQHYAKLVTAAKSTIAKPKVAVRHKKVRKYVPHKHILYSLELKESNNYNSVNHLKAELALLGLEANIVKINKHHKGFYRLTLGPYANKKLALASQEWLAKHEIKSNLHKI